MWAWDVEVRVWDVEARVWDVEVRVWDVEAKGLCGSRDFRNLGSASEGANGRYRGSSVRTFAPSPPLIV